MSVLNTLLPRRARGETPAGRTGVSTAGTVAPAYRVNETEEAYGLQVFLPGVTKYGLDLSLEKSEITLVARREWKKPEGWTPLYREIRTADFALTLRHDNTFDAERVRAELKDGVLYVTLPKAEANKPRKIQVG
jgi:HSP20 family molecular chaperone IbpA